MIHLESLPDAVVVVDAEGRIVTVNSHMESLLGYGRDELVGQPVERLVPVHARDGHRGHRRGYQAEPRVRAMGAGGHLTALHKSGREVPVEIMLSPASDGGVVAVLRDISRRQELERFRDDYVGYISHDLKNPLSVITLQARLLSRRLAERGLEEDLAALDVISQSAGYIDRMVREMLEMSYLESDDVALAREPRALDALLKAILERTLSTSDRWRVHLEVHNMVVALVDVHRVERVVANLVQNAVKYSEPESAILVRLEAQGGSAVVSVIDRGVGLSPDESRFVFDKYRRTSAAVRRDGLGLGLYISRKIVEAHGGTIGVESVRGRGSRFHFSLPLATHQEEPIALRVQLDPGPPPALASLRGVHVLLVDDEVNALSALAKLLDSEGLEVSTATSGTEALAVLRSIRPDAVVLDVEMPDMSGVALLEKVRALLPGVPAIFMTGFLPQHHGIAEARRLTGASYVGKPVDVDGLLRTIDAIIPNRSPRGAEPTATP